MPLTRTELDGSNTVLDTVVGGDAVAIVGYQDTPDPNNPMTYRPGGGYFIFKNSWGTDWAANNTTYGSGFGLMPYAYLQAFNEDAYTIS
jgi:C1A family cysteine protease